jgi:hypothetical protein
MSFLKYECIVWGLIGILIIFLQNSSKAKRHLDEGPGSSGSDLNLGGENYEPPKKMAGSIGGSPGQGGPSSIMPGGNNNKRGGSGAKMKLFGSTHGPSSGSSSSSGSLKNNNISSSTSSMGSAGMMGGEHASVFVDLEQCAAALDEDSSILMMGDSESAFKELLSDLDPDFMEDFDLGYEDKSDSTSNPNSNNNNNNNNQPPPPQQPSSLSTNSCNNNNVAHAPVTPQQMGGGVGGGPLVKMEDLLPLHHQPLCAGPSPAPASTASPLASQLDHHFHGGSPSSHPNTKGRQQQQQQQHPAFSNSPGGGASSLSIDSPAAQTLKQMAEQHQHKASSSFKTSPARSPYSSDSYSNSNNNYPSASGNNDFMGGGGASGNAAGNYGPRLGHSPDLGSIKQEVCSPTTQSNFSPGAFMDVNGGGVGMAGKRSGNPVGPRSLQQQQQQQIGSPVNKSFNHSNSSGGMDLPSMSGQSFGLGRPPNNNSNPSPNNAGCYNPVGFPTNNSVSSGPQQVRFE